MQSAAFAQQPAPALQPVLLETSVNGQAGSGEVYALRDGEGRIYVRSSDLAAWRIRLPSPVTVEQEGQRFTLLTGVDGLRVQIDEATQRLVVDAEPRLFETARIAAGERRMIPMTATSSGGFLNYDLYAQSNGGAVTSGAFVEAGAFTGGGFGSSSFLAHAGSGKPGILRLETSWTIDNPGALRSLRFGDTISRGGAASAPVRFGGVQWGTNFSVRPGYLTMPLPTLNGSAALPSTADIYINDALALTQAVPPGPFQVVNPPALSGIGEIRLVVRDMLGRQSVASFDYYGSNALLRPGLHDFSYEAGFLRRDFGRRSMRYGDFMAAGTHRYGITRWLTGEVHAEASAKRQLASATATMIVAGQAMLSVTGAASRDSGRTGYFAGFSIERQTQGLSFSASAEFASRNYGGVWVTSNYRLSRQTVRALATMPVGRARLGANYLMRDWWDGRRERLVGVTASVPVRGLGIVGLSGMQTTSGRRSNLFELFLSVPLGRTVNASAGVQTGTAGRSASASIQRNLPTDEGFGYYGTVSTGAVNRAEGTLLYQTGTQTYEVGASQLNGRTAFRAGASGSLAFIGGGLEASRSFGESFALVDAGHPGVRVYRDNNLVGRTNGAGQLMVPNLRAYDENLIRIEQGDLPVDAQIQQFETLVRPYARNGLHVRYAAKPSYSATLRLVREDGTPVPAGAWAHIEGKEEPFVVAQGGDLYLSGLQTGNRILVEWAGGRCAFALAYVPGSDPQPDLGRQTCRSAAVEAH